MFPLYTQSMKREEQNEKPLLLRYWNRFIFQAKASFLFVLDTRNKHVAHG